MVLVYSKMDTGDFSFYQKLIKLKIKVFFYHFTSYILVKIKLIVLNKV